MKTPTLLLTCLFLGAAALNAQQAGITTTTTTKTVTYGDGTITQYTPGTTFIVNETGGPVTYQYGKKKIVYENKDGKVISETDLATRVKVGTPVQVYYDMDGNARVISRVVINDQ